jgi:hypothetical protein
MKITILRLQPHEGGVVTIRIDPSQGWRTVQERLDRTSDPRHRAMLETVVGHMKAEANLELEGLLDGQVAEPEYHLWGSGTDTGPKGGDAVRAYYTALVEAKRGILEYGIERIVVDDDTIVTEGYIRAYQPASVARDFGYDIDGEDGTYLVTYRALVIWPFNADGLLRGEDGYAGINPADAERVPRSELPAAYVAQFEESGLASL